jgi:putative RecB family exonuclease
LRYRWPDARAITLIWHYLAFDHEIQITKTAQQLDAIKFEVLGLIARIEATTSFPASVTPLCDWCEYKEICPAMLAKNIR